MNAEVKTTMPAADTEPAASLATVPMWLMVLMLCLLFLGAWYFDKRGGWFEPKVYGPYVSLAQVQLFQPPSGGDQEIRRGKVVYEMCALCHNPDGMGKPNQAPPLAGSDWVIAEGANRLIRIPLLGLNGPIEVSGKSYSFNAGMTSFGSLRDEDIAAVLTYIRQAWGHKASPVTVEQVQKVRSELGNRTQSFTPEELKRLPE